MTNQKTLTIEQIENRFSIKNTKRTAELKILTVLGHLVANGINFNGMEHLGSNYFFTLYLSYMDFCQAKEKLSEIETLYFVKNEKDKNRDRLELFICDSSDFLH